MHESYNRGDQKWACIRQAVNILFLTAVGTGMIVTTTFCGGGGGGGGGPQVPTESFGIEFDRMELSESAYLEYIFNDEFEKAKPSAAVSVQVDEDDISTQMWLDERNGEVTNFIYLHRNLDLSNYDGECYIACVECIYDDFGTIVAGLAFWNIDPAIQGEAACAIATWHIKDTWYGIHPQPENMWFWYIAWASAHELGHCFCLYHCGSGGCIMESEINVGGNVHKTYCANCAAKINENWP